MGGITRFSAERASLILSYWQIILDEVEFSGLDVVGHPW
jgi:hypothetical protein